MKLPVNYELIDQRERRLVREEYIKVQDGLCSHCHATLESPPSLMLDARPVDAGLFPKGFFRWPVHLHHDHETGMTIGAVHAHCNAVLWQYEGE